METAELWIVASHLLGVVAVSVMAGAAAGFVGSGGGAVLAPGFMALYASLGASEETRAAAAIGTALGVIAPLSARALVMQRLAAEPEWALLRGMGPWLALGAVLGAFAASVAPGWAATLLCSAACVALGAHLLSQRLSRDSRARPRGDPPVIETGGVVGAVMGGLSALGLGALTAAAGQGGGGFAAAALASRGLREMALSATAAAIGLIVAVAGAATMAIVGALDDRPTAGLIALGHVDLAAVAIGAPFFAISAVYSARLIETAQAFQTTARFLFSLILIVIGVTLLREALL